MKHAPRRWRAALLFLACACGALALDDPAPPPPAPPAGDASAAGPAIPAPPAGKPDEVEQAIAARLPPEGPWQLSGARLTGSAAGPVEIDSLVIRHGQLTIGARHGVWRPAAQRVEMHGGVEIRDPQRVLRAERGSYHRERLFLEMEFGVEGDGPEGRMRADRLTYDRIARLLSLSGRVCLEESTRTLHGDWLRYDLAESLATVGGRVRLEDPADSVDVFGDLLVYDRAAGSAIVTGERGSRPRLVRRPTSTEAALVVEADTLRYDAVQRAGEAYGDVRFVRGGVNGRCARGWFDIARDGLLLTGAPAVQDSEGVIQGDSIRVVLRAGRADRMTVWGHARAEYFPRRRPGEAHFAIGDSLSAFLEGGVMRTVLVEQDAEALYVPSPADRAQEVGLNWTRGDRIRLITRDGGVSRIQFEGQVNGRYVLPQRAPPETTATPGAAGADSGSAAPVAWSAEDPPGLAAIRRGAAGGSLEPGDSLLAVLSCDPRETVTYSGAALEFINAENRIIIRDQARVGYHDMELAAAEIVFDSPRDLVSAAGEPVLRDRDSEVRGERMTYRLDTRRGLVFEGRSEFEGGHYRGARVKRVTPETFFVRDAEFTSCDADKPHYHFRAARMKVMAQDRVVARPVVLYLGELPLLAIPYAAFPIRSGRRSGLLIPDVEFGFDSARGRFLRNVGYYIAPNDYLDALFWMDYYELAPSLAFNGRMRYKLRYLLGGQVEGSFARQERSGGARRDRWLLNLDHDQTLGERFTLKASGRFQSDKDYAADRDFGASVDERVNRVLRSQMSLHKSWSLASLSLAADRTEYLDEASSGSVRISQAAPSVNFALSALPLGRTADARGRGGRRPYLASTYLRADLRLRSVYSRPWAGQATVNHAAGVTASLSDKRRLWGALNLTPSATLAAAWAREDAAGRPDPTGWSWRTGLSAGATFYGTFFPRLGPWEGLRHVVELSAGYAYSPELPELRGFPSVGGISLSSAKSSRVSLHATQRFHIKVRRGEESSKKENLLIWDSSTSYDFLAAERAREAGTAAHPWADLSHSLRLQPGRLLESDLSLVHDIETWSRKSLSLRTGLRLAGGAGAGAAGAPEGEGEEDALGGHGDFGDPEAGAGSGPDRTPAVGSLTGPWRLSATHVFSLGREWETHRSSVNLSASLAVTSGWQLQYSVYYDLGEQEVTSQGYSLYRDLHCWHATLERHTSGGRSSYYFRISIKDLPDVKYERRRSE